VLGFPIRTSADRCLVDGSPQLFAVTHVLHRFLAPRHPPLALSCLEYNSFKRTKMLVLALQFSRCERRFDHRDEANGEKRHEEANSLKTEEKTATAFNASTGGTESLTTVSYEDADRQCTNWECLTQVVRKHDPTERDSLERR